MSKRGRPRVFSDKLMVNLDATGFFMDTHSNRSKQNIAYRQRAIALLENKFPWICDKEKCLSGEKGAWKPTLLTELGRIKDQETMQDVAERICELRPKTTREAVYMVRRYRLNQDGEGDCIGLSSKIIATINEYLKRFPKTMYQQIATALQNAQDATDECFSE